MRRATGNELDLVWAVDVSCENCGRTRRLQRRTLASLRDRGYHTLAQLGSRLYCMACQERNAGGRNVSVVPHWIGEGRRDRP